MLLRYLHALGHRRIVHVTVPAELEHTVLRTRALQTFAAEHRLEDAETLTTDYSAESGASMTRMLLSRRQRPTAIVYDNDVLAVAGLGVAKEMGVDRKSVVEGKSVSVRVDRGGRRIIKKKNKDNTARIKE